MVTPVYQARDPSATVLYQVIAAHLETFLATLATDPTAKGLPHYVTEEFYAYLQCGILAHGFVRLGCDTCPHQMVLAFSWKKRGLCPSCAGRRMAQMAAHLVEHVIPWVPTRQWVVAVPIPLRYWMAPSRELSAKVHTIIRRTSGQYYVNRAVRHGAARATVQPGSVTFLQRVGGALNLHVHVHIIFLEGVYEDRTAQGLRPRFIPHDPPTDAEVVAMLHTMSQRVIRELRKLGYLEAGTQDVAPTGYDPASDEDPELARTLAEVSSTPNVTSVPQRLAFGERAGQRVRRMGSGFGDDGARPTLTGTRGASVNGFSLHATTHIPAHRRDELERLLRYTARGAVALERLEEGPDGDLLYTFTRPWSDGTTGITLSPMALLEKLAALVPLPRMHVVRYGGCLAPHSHVRAALIPTPRQQGLEEPAGRTASPNWTWARLLKRVFLIDIERCPVCQQGRRRIIAAIMERSVIQKILRYVKRAVDPPPIAPARQAAFAWAF